ncbi:hypothetical protein NDU88_006033 [Pleurodeles waltl]|uniref:Uncharacterized protein n=1 Tax=Pleurodeles waltl TaxID=8319 RepID=A0AAV7MC51_PLEWA|nr:hypothetical protein NDU88_006033 [Pleurodeles waltl]
MGCSPWSRHPAGWSHGELAGNKIGARLAARTWLRRQKRPGSRDRAARFLLNDLSMPEKAIRVTNGEAHARLTATGQIPEDF